jgi:AcrR family transcriptional regulator
MSAAERRAQLIDVGRKVFAQGGYEQTTVEQVADAAHVSKPVIYEHFGGKEGLYAVIVDREMDNVVARITDAIASGEPRDRFAGAVAAFFAYVRDEPDGFALLCHDAPTIVAKGGMSSLLAMVGERVSRVFSDSFKAAGYSPRYAPVYAQALIGMVTFVGRWWMENPSLPVDRVASHLAALAWMGLRHLPKRPDPVPVPRADKPKPR